MKTAFMWKGNTLLVAALGARLGSGNPARFGSVRAYLQFGLARQVRRLGQ
jgi:hypothetical protein